MRLLWRGGVNASLRLVTILHAQPNGVTTLTTQEALTILRANKTRNATFTSDPLNGDTIKIHDDGQDTVENLLLTLDFEAYDGNGPTVTV